MKEKRKEYLKNGEKIIRQLKRQNNNFKTALDEGQEVIIDYIKENQELKKQLTTYQILHRDCEIDNLKNISKIEEKETQQKEFIKFLEDNYKETQDIWYIKILQKYKEIIGSDSEC